jgi:ankyrin repeat protein
MTHALNDIYYSQQLLDLVANRQPLSKEMVVKLDLGQRDAEGKNSLYWAIKNKSKRNVTLLIEHGVSLMVTPGKHAMFHAVETNNIDALMVLMEKGLNVNIHNETGQSLLMKALEIESLVMVQYLINCKIDLYMMDDNYDMAIDYAKKCKETNLYELVHYKVLNDDLQHSHKDCGCCSSHQQSACNIEKTLK